MAVYTVLQVFLMVLTAALKAQMLLIRCASGPDPDLFPVVPQRQMIADVARTLAGEEGRHLAIEAPTGVGKTSILFLVSPLPEEQKHWWSVPLTWRYRIRSLAKTAAATKIIPDLLTAAFGRGRYVSAKSGGARQ